METRRAGARPSRGGCTSRVTDIATRENASATPEPVATGVEYLPFYPAGLFADGAAAPGLDMPHLDGLAGFTHGNGLSLLLNYDADGRPAGKTRRRDWPM